MIRVCQICKQTYSYPSPDPNIVTGLRRCDKCLRLKHVTWKCPCGKTFSNRDSYYNHRREMKEQGTPCKNFIQKESFGKCPYCGMIIGTSKNEIETKRECVANHKCDGVKAIEAQGISFYRVFAFLRKLRKSMKAGFLSRFSEDFFLQFSWVQGIFDNKGFDIPIYILDKNYKNRCLIFSEDLQAIWVFDNNISQDFKLIFQSLKWDIFNYKWTDCILNSEKYELDVLNRLKDKIKNYKAQETGSLILTHKRDVYNGLTNEKI